MRRVDDSNEITIQEGEALLRFCGRMSEMATTYLCTEVHSYALDSSLTLRGVPKLVDNKVQFDGDIYASDGTVQRRYGIVTYDGSNDEVWSAYGTQGYYIAKNDMKKRVSSYRGALICNNLTVYPSNYGNDFGSATYAITGWDNGSDANHNYLYIKANEATASSVSNLRAWLSSNPVTVVYELATPTAETASPYVSMNISSPTYFCTRFILPPVMVSMPVSTSVTRHGSDSLL